MLRSTPALTALLPLLGGCVINIEPGDDEADDQASGDGDADTSTTAGTTTSTDDDVGTSDATSSDTSSETGEELCGIEPGDAPWITLSQLDMAIVEGSPVRIECGGQGSFMIRFSVGMGGFSPSDPDVPVHVTLDVEGYNLGVSGHFGEFDYPIFAGCCDPDYTSPNYCGYYDPLLITLFPPDQIPDLTVLHELPATLTISMSADGTPVEQTIAVQMWAMDDGSWEFCNYGYGYTTGYGGTGYGTGGYGTGGTGGLVDAALPIPL